LARSKLASNSPAENPAKAAEIEQWLDQVSCTYNN
jgi:hypothetical protein